MHFKILVSLFVSVMALPAFAVDSSDIKVPSKIWEEIESSEGNNKNISYAFFPITVILTERTPGVLFESPTKIDLPRGGGEIDLSKYVRKEQGTFYVSFDFEQKDQTEGMKVYFVSQARKRKVDGDIWGAGCRKYMDIKDYFLKTISKQGLSVNTTRNRHLTVLGGNFVFAVKSGKQVLLSQVTFKDSTEPQLFCDFKE